jgi:predicted alpha-1,6-mannanase (GH76 family)
MLKKKYNNVPASNPFYFLSSFLNPQYKKRKKQSKQMESGMNSDSDESR